MKAPNPQVLAQAAAWLQAGQAVHLVTVVRTWGSSPRPPGAQMALAADGRIAGSVSGGCVEDDLRRWLLDTPPPAPVSRVYGRDEEDARRFGLPCGGVLEVVVEPKLEAASIEALLLGLSRRQVLRRSLDLGSGAVVVEEAASAEEFRFDGERMVTVHGPRWRLLMIGAGQTSRCLAEMAEALDYHVEVCDPRPSHADAWDLPAIEICREQPDDWLRRLRPDGRTVVAALSHDPKLDDLALLEALSSEAFYVGAIGSVANNVKRRERLAEHFGLGIEQLARLHGPVGLPLGGRTPAEIALAVLAEVTALRHGRNLVSEAPGSVARRSPSQALP